MKNRLSVFVVLILGLSGVANAATSKIIFHPPNGGGMGGWFGSMSSPGPNNDEKLRIGGEGYGGEYNAVVRFDTSGLPQVAIKVSMVLDLFDDGAEGDWAQLAVCLNLEQWQAHSVNWANQPYSPTCNVLPNPPTKAGAYTIDVTEAYNQWRTGESEAPFNFGLKLKPEPTPPTAELFSSAWSNAPPPYEIGPYLVVEYNAASLANDVKLIKWPLHTPYAGRVIKAPWASDSLVACPGSGFAQNAGVNYAAPAATTVFAAEDGFVKEITDGGPLGWGVVLQHNRPPKLGGKATSVYWHINPDVYLAVGDFVPKGHRIGAVSDLADPLEDQLHFGIRLNAYTAGTSGLEGLTRKNTSCGGLPPWQSKFINPENTTLVVFQP